MFQRLALSAGGACVFQIQPFQFSPELLAEKTAESVSETPA
jgi:hypothetical protein